MSGGGAILAVVLVVVFLFISSILALAFVSTWMTPVFSSVDVDDDDMISEVSFGLCCFLSFNLYIYLYTYI